MELFPIYEENIEISPKIWYSLSGIGESPMMRVGHTLIHLNFAKNNENEEEKGKLFLIGGANPSGSFNDVYIFDMNKLNWDKLVDLENFEIGRYEHSCFFSDKDRHVYIFGGASENGNLNEILQFDFESENICKKMNNESTNKPSARTIHGGVVYKNQLLIFGGGLSGNQPVDDEKVYIYNPSTDKWISLNIQGESPQQRHGHLMLNFQDEMIFLHGGMNLEHIYDDLWCLNLKTIKWQRVNYDTNKPYPQPRAAHGGITINKNIYIFGGLSKSGQALDDLWKYNTGNLKIHFKKKVKFIN
jgi:N-acetylneuraminic acid mutarotase